MAARLNYRLMAAALCVVVTGSRAGLGGTPELEAPSPVIRTPFSPRIPSPHLFSGEMRLSHQRSDRRAATLQQPRDEKPAAPTIPLRPADVQPAQPTQAFATNRGLDALPQRQASSSAAPQSASGAPLRPASVQSVALHRDVSHDDRLTRLTGPSALLQPAEVFSIPRPDFFAEEIQLAGLDQQLPSPAALLPAEIEPAGPLAHPPEPKVQLALLQQPLPLPQNPLQPAEVLPSTPYNPAAPRIPALDQDRPIGALTTNIAPVSGRLPQDIAAEHFGGDYPPWASRGYSETVYFWDAPALCYGPLRFEEVNLERYGYGCCHVLEPFVSAVHFAGHLVSLPYNIVNRPCWECIYPLGHYRPGSPVPYRKIWPEFDPLAAAGECGLIAGLILLIP